MKGYLRLFLMALLALAAASFTAVAQKAAGAAAQAPEEEETPYDEVEYKAYEDAAKEPDLEKRGTMLLDFIQKYPKSALMPHINSAYEIALKECQTGQKWSALESLAEKWLKLHPNDVNTLAFVALATNELKKYDRCVECYEEIYKMQPSATLAKEIYNGYQKTNNLARQQEWAEKLFKMPEFDSDFAMRYDFVTKHTKSNNIPKAAEYAQLTLKSADLVTQQDEKTQEQLRMVRRNCFHIIGTNLEEKARYAEAISAYTRALKAERYGEGYYRIAQCQENLKQIDEAILSYAKAEKVGGEDPDTARKSKARLEVLYKALHNNTTIGIDKVYRKAEEELSGMSGKKELAQEKR